MIMNEKKEKTAELIEEPLISEKEKFFEIPENWKWIRLEQACKIEMGQSPKGEYTSKNSNDTPLIGGPADMGENYPDAKRYTSKPIKISAQNDLIVSVRATLGKTNFSNGEFCLGRGVASISSSVIEMPLLKHYFKIIESYLYKVSTGTTFSQITKKQLGNSPFPLAPYNEQKRIAVKLEHLLNKLDEAEKIIEETRKTFEFKKASILDKAFKGELTRKWRKNNDIKVAADNLLKSSIGNEKSLKNDPLDSKVLEGLSELPTGWKWVRLSDLIEKSNYGTSSKTTDDNKGTPVLRMGNIVNGKLRMENLKYLPSDHIDVQKLKLEANDLLFNRTNSYELVGKTAVVPKELAGKTTFASYLIRVSLNSKGIIANYISYYINSHVGRNLLMTMVTQQVGQANINSKKLAALPVPLPPKEEIQEISSLLTNYFEKEAQVKELLSLQEYIETTKKSILSKAFRGELATNELTEEEPIELLKNVISKD